MDDDLSLPDVIRRLGWTASRAELIEASDRGTLEQAIRDGAIVRVGRGRYGLAESLGPAQQAAVRVNGVASHLSAATRLGLAVREPPPLPTITVPHGRKLTPERRAGAEVFCANLADAEVRDGVTTPLRTVLDCAARLPFAEALVVADSALARRLITHTELLRAAATAPARFRSRVLNVARHADSRAASAFESLVRGHSIGVPGLLLEPQVPIAGFTPDLLDKHLRLGVECDSFEFHSQRKHLVRDCERYNMFTVGGVALLRFAWEHSMHNPGYIRSTLMAAVATREAELGLTH